MDDSIELHATVPIELAGARVDQALAALFPDYSRSILKRWLQEGAALVDGVRRRPKDRLAGGEAVSVRATPERREDWGAESGDIDVVFSDEDIIVIDKPAGLVVHPGAGNASGTLVNRLLAFDPALATLPRAGIVHRLDKDTTGLMVVARTLPAHTRLVDMISTRAVERFYEAVVVGVPTAGATIDAAIARHPRQRTKMAVVDGGRTAVTHFTVAEKFHAHSHLLLKLETGRTHQIRVHLSHIGYPIVGDATYGARSAVRRGMSETARSAVHAFSRPALHARRLAFEHPRNGSTLVFERPAPSDIADLIEALRR